MSTDREQPTGSLLPSTAPGGGNAPISLYPSISNSLQLPRPTLLSTVSTMTSAKAAPALKPRQVTPETDEGDSAATDALVPTSLSRASTSSAVALPASTADETYPVTGGRHRMTSHEEPSDKLFCAHSDTSSPSKERSDTSSFSSNSSTKMDDDDRPETEAPTQTKIAGMPVPRYSPPALSKSRTSYPAVRSCHGTLCLNTTDLTDRDGSEDEPLAVFRDAIYQGATTAAAAPPPVELPTQQPSREITVGAAKSSSKASTASSFPVTSVSNLAKRAQQQALEAHIRAEAAIALARQAAELEAIERNLAAADQRIPAAPAATTVTSPSGAYPSSVGGGIYPTIPGRGGTSSISTSALVTATEESKRHSSGKKNDEAILTSLIESQRFREQLLATNPDTSAAAPSALDQLYPHLLSGSSSSNTFSQLAAAGLSSHLVQSQLLGLNRGSYGLGLGVGTCAAAYGGSVQSEELRRMVEKEENELLRLQEELRQQQQQHLQYKPSDSSLGANGGKDQSSDAKIGDTSKINVPTRAGPVKKRLKYTQAGGVATALNRELESKRTYSSTATTSTQPQPTSLLPSTSSHKRLLLYSPEDHHWLSDQLCFVRKLIEVFEANEEDVTARSRRGGMKRPIQVGRVGLRCVHCSGVQAKQRAKGAVSYPNSIRIVHQAIRNFQRYHLMQCPNMPQSIKDEYASLKTTRCHSGNASLQYWVTSCHALGMCDTDPESGIRLRPPPSQETLNLQFLSPSMERSEELCSSTMSERQNQDGNMKVSSVDTSREMEVSSETNPTNEMDRGQESNAEGSGATRHAIAASTITLEKDGIPVTLESTPYMSLILAQQRPTYYQPADSLGKRRPRPSGFPGMECKHCASPPRVASPGRYFPLTTTVLANNNNPGGCVYVHLMKCGRCPQEIKVNLQELAERHAKDGESLQRGWRRRLFTALWDRLHKGHTWTEEFLRQSGCNYIDESEEDEGEGGGGGDDVGTAALALSALSGLAGAGTKRKTPPEGEE